MDVIRENILSRAGENQCFTLSNKMSPRGHFYLIPLQTAKTHAIHLKQNRNTPQTKALRPLLLSHRAFTTATA